MRRPGFLGSTNYWFANKRKKRRNSLGKWTPEQRFHPLTTVPPEEEEEPEAAPRPAPKPVIKPKRAAPPKPKAAAPKPKPKAAPKAQSAASKSCEQGAQNLLSRGMATMARFPGGIKAFCAGR